MQPINYLLSGQSPFEALMGGMDGFQKYDNNKLVLQQNRIANEAAQQKADYVKQAQQEAQTLDYNDPNAIHKFIAKYESTGLTKGLTDYVARLDTNERQGMLTDTSKALSLINNGDIVGAEQLARSKAQAYQNAKNPTKAAEYNQVADMIKNNPTAAQQHLQWNMALLAPKDAGQNYKDMMGATTPTVKDINSGGETGGYVIDPITRKVTYQKFVDNTVSPDAQLKANTDITNNQNDNETKITTANIAADTSRYAADKSSETGIKVANINGQFGVKKEQISQTGQTQRFNAQQVNEMNQSEVKSIGGYLMRVYKNGRVDVIGKDNTAAKSPANTAKVAEIQGQNDTANQLIQSLQKAKELNKQGIYSGYGANGRADAMGFFGGTEDSRRTQQYTNIMTGAALQQLKSIFGAAPTEGERAILMKLQASAEYPPQVREQILNDAIAAAQARIASNNRQMQTLGGQVPSAPQQSTAQPQGGYISNKYK